MNTRAIVLAAAAVVAVAVGGVTAAAAGFPRLIVDAAQGQSANATTAAAVPEKPKCQMPGPDTTDAKHWYVEAFQCGTDFRGVSATATIPQPAPAIDKCNGEHSNGQITLEQDGPGDRKAIEVSWVSLKNSPGVYLQVGQSVGEQHAASDYPSDKWMPLPAPPDPPNYPQPLQSVAYVNMSDPLTDPLALTKTQQAASIVNTKLDLEIKYEEPTAGGKDKDGRWVVWVSGRPIGYYPDKKTFGPGGLHPQRAEWWGEVATSGACSTYPDTTSCTAMGNGKPGTDGNAVGFSNLKATQASGIQEQGPPARYLYVTDPSLYTSDRYSGAGGGVKGFDGDSFRYGGPGRCPAAKPVVHPAPVVKTKPKVTVKPRPKPAPSSTTANSNQNAPDSSESQQQSEQPTHESSGESSSCGKGMVRVGPETESSSGCAPAGSQKKSQEEDSPTTPANGGVQDQVCPPVCGNNGGGDGSNNRGGLGWTVMKVARCCC